MKRIQLAMENLASAVAYAEEGRRDDALRLIDELAPIRCSSEAKVILAATRTRFSEPALVYVQGLLERMPCHLLALTSEPRRRTSRRERRRERKDVLQALEQLTRPRGMVCVHQTFSGGLCDAIQKYCGLIRDVRFAVIQAQAGTLAHCALPIPVFLVQA